jgi:hypothetical protein
VALTIGELTAYLRADDTGLRRGLRRAESAMRSTTAAIGAAARTAARALRALGPAAAGVGVGIPAAAAAATALMGVAAGAAAAGAAVGAFKAAVGPQMEAIAEVADLAAKAEEAAAEGGEKAAEATQAYKDAMADLPGPTRQAAKAFIGLKSDYQEWSDGLSGTTMPVVTKGIELLRDLLPQLTPFVKAAAGALGGFLDEVAAGVKSARFKEWATDMATAAGPALRNFLTVIKNLAVGFGGLVQAFLPHSGQMTGGLVSMSQAFADWGTSLQGSEGFARFLDLAKQGAATLGTLATAAGNLLVALGPLIGITVQVASALAEIVNALPPGVLEALATAIVTATLAWKAYSAASDAVEGAQRLLRSSAMATARAWVASAARSVAAMARVAARAAVSAARTAAVWALAAARMTATWLASMIRVAAVTVARFAMMAARAVIWAATMAAQWLIAMGPIGWIIAAVIGLVALVVANWDKIKKYTVAAWNWIWKKIKQFAGFIWDLFLNWTIVGRVIKHWDQIKAGTKRVWNSVVSWVRGIPGRIVRALGNLGSLLYNSGLDVVRGLWRGIRAMGSWLRSTLIGWARDLIPGPIADALGISSPSKVMAKQVGRWIPAGVVSGIESGERHLDSTMAGLVNVPRAGAPSAAGGRGAGGGRPLLVNLSIGGREFGQLWVDTGRQEIHALGGDVQAAIGRL